MAKSRRVYVGGDRSGEKDDSTPFSLNSSTDQISLEEADNTPPMSKPRSMSTDSRDPKEKKKVKLKELNIRSISKGNYEILNEISPEMAEQFKEERNLALRRSLSTVEKNSTKLGEGNFASIFLAIPKDEKKNPSKLVAAKRLTAETQNEELIKNEMAILQELKHPNIIPPLEFGKDSAKKEWLLFLPLMDHSLQEILPIYDNSMLSIRALLYITKSIIAGLKYLHQKNIVHFDLRAPNILIKGGQVFIGDFGAAVIGQFKKNLTDFSSKILMSKEDFNEKIESNFFQDIILPEKTGSKQDDVVDISKVDIYFLGFLCTQILNIQHQSDGFNLTQLYSSRGRLQHLCSEKNVNLGTLAFYVLQMLSDNPKERPSAKKLAKLSIFQFTKREEEVAREFLINNKK